MGRSMWKFQRGIVYSTGGKVRDLKSNEFCCKVVRSLTLETFKEIMDHYVFWLCKREHRQGFPGGPMVKNPPCTIKKKKPKESGLQHGGHGFNPWFRKILHAEEQLSRGATTTESMVCDSWSPLAYSSCSATQEATTMRSPHTSTRESPCAAVETQHSQNTK